MAEKFINPIVIQRADPSIYLNNDGYYYFTATHPLFDRIILRKSKDINELKNAKEISVWNKEKSGPLSNLIWAPEIHKIENVWYIYFAAAPNTNIQDNTYNHRMYVLVNNNKDPMTDNWVLKGQIKTEMDTFSLDATVFEHNSKLYYVWAQQDLNIKGHSNIYISEMSNPWTLVGEEVLLTKPEYSWETQGFWVNEGPAILKKGNKIFLTYSGSSTGIDYCMGMLYTEADSNLLDSNNWIKMKEPVFKTSIENNQFGPGHNSFTQTKKGTFLNVYHARNYSEVEGNPLYDPNRHSRVQTIKWSEKGFPIFGEPVKDDRDTPKNIEIVEGDYI